MQLSAVIVHDPSMEAAGFVEGKISQESSPPCFFTGVMQGELPVRCSLCECRGSRVIRAELKCCLVYTYSLVV